MPEETQFEDAEAFTYNFNKDKITFKDIILLHLKKIGEYASVEYRGGYWETKTKMSGGLSIEERYYIPDTREVYSNSINYLADMLFPYFDAEMKKAFDKADKETEDAFRDTSVIVEPDKEDDNPKEEKEYRSFKDIESRTSFRSIRVNINRKLFRALCCFLFRKKYLEVGSIED